MKLTFYHGSGTEIKGNKIKADSMMLGNMLEDPSYAVYMWRKKDNAYPWALYNLIQRTCEKLNLDCFSKVRLNLFVYPIKINIEESAYKTLLNAVVGKKCYVYDCTADITDLGLGHSAYLDEIVSKKDVKITKRETIEVTNHFFVSMTDVKPKSWFNDPANKNKYMSKYTGLFTRGLPNLLMYGDDKVFSIRKRIREKIKSGEFKQGDDLAKMVDIVKKEMANESYDGSKMNQSNESYYRVTFDSKGIYDELKKAVGFNWKNLRTNPNISWLPTPTVEYGSHRSYFTEKGYSEFQKRTLPLIEKYLDSRKIEVKEFNAPKGKIVYKDQYQIVTTESYEPTMENLLFSQDDYKHNYDKWVTGENKILYVVGLSGSGKTTMTNQLAKEFNCKVIHCDDVHYDMAKKFKKDEYLTKYSKEEWKRLIWKEIVRRAGNDRAIIEGITTVLYNVPDLKDQSLVITGTSTITSTFRMIKRTLSSDPLQGLPAFFKEYKGRSKIDMLLKMLHAIWSCTKHNFTIGNELDDLKKVGENMNYTSETTTSTKNLIPHKGYRFSTFVTRGTPVNEGIFDKGVKVFATGVGKLAKHLKDTKSPYYKEDNKCDYPDGPASFRRALINHKKNLSGKYTKLTDYTELIYFKYPENLCKNIAKKHAKPSSEFFVHTSNLFGNKHLGEFMVGGDDGFVYCPELNKWYWYDVEKKVPIDIKKPVSFSYIQSFAKKQINECFVPVQKNLPITESIHGEEITKKEIEKNVRFVEGTPGTMNAVYEINGRQYRVRVETLVLRNLHGEPHVFFEDQHEINLLGRKYKLPGGSIEPNKSFMEQAQAECNEEIRVKVKNLRYAGVSYIKDYPEGKRPAWQERVDALKRNGVEYVGMITFVFIGEYDGPYNKYIKKVDRDDLKDNGKWYPVRYFNSICGKEHKGLLDAPGLYTESYVAETSIYYDKSQKDEIFREFKKVFDSSKYKAELLLDNMGQLGGRIPSPSIAIIHTRPGFDGDKENISKICKEATKRSKKYVFKRQSIGSPAFAHFIRHDIPLAIPYPNLVYGIVAYPKSLEKKYRTAAYECFVTEGVSLMTHNPTKKLHRPVIKRHATDHKYAKYKQPVKIVSNEQTYLDWF